MSEIHGEFADIEGAFERPMLKLLNRPDRQVLFAVLRLAFTREHQGLEAPVLHRRVEQYLADLDSVGIEVPKFGSPPTIDGKLTCRRWMDADAIDKRRDVKTGADYYFLASPTLTALSHIGTMTRDRSGVSEHRVGTIMDAVSKLNRNINPDVNERKRILQDEIDERAAELQRLDEGGELGPVDDDYIIDGFDNLLRLFSALPGDFGRVIERMADQRQVVVNKFHSDTGRVGDHLIEYLDMANGLMNGTPEGRAFIGAMELLRDDKAKVDLRRNIESLLSNPQAQALLRETEQRDLRNLLLLMMQGFDAVLDARDSISTVLREQILSHNLDRDIAMDAALRSLEKSVTFSFKVGRAQDKIECEVLPHANEVEDLPNSFFDPADDLPPEPLPERKERQLDPAATFAKLLSQGGPSLRALRSALITAADDLDLDNLPPGAPVPTVGEVFESLPEDLRRPVEVIGLMHISGAASKAHKARRALSATSATTAPVPDGDMTVPPDVTELDPDGVTERERFRCIRPDGTEVVLLGPRVRLDRHLIDRLRKTEKKAEAAS